MGNIFSKKRGQEQKKDRLSIGERVSNLLTPPDWKLLAQHPDGYPFCELPESSERSGPNGPLQAEAGVPDFVYFHGAGYDRDPDRANEFHQTFLEGMHQSLGGDFHEMDLNHEGSRLRSSICDVDWSLRNGDSGMSGEEIDQDELMTRSLERMGEITANMEGESLNLIGSSGGTGPAAQTALYLLNNREEFGLGEDQRITLTLSSKMLHEDAPLMQDLANHQDSGHFELLIQDFEEDNIDGISGTDGNIAEARAATLDAFFNPANGNESMTGFPFPPKNLVHPSNVLFPLNLLNPWNQNGLQIHEWSSMDPHPHSAMADSTAKANSLIRTLLIERQFGSEEQRLQAESVLAEMEAEKKMAPVSALEETEDLHTLP